MAEEKELTDIERLQLAMAKVQDLQELALKYDIDDIFQDNGGKVLQSLIILGLKASPGREGNDAVDENGNEYELKTLNVNKQNSVTTNHHLNLEILAKYRQVKAWYISLYEGINLGEIYRIETRGLESVFSEWETKIRKNAQEKGVHDTSVTLNNPHISLRVIAMALNTGTAVRVYPANLEGPSLLERKLAKKPRASKKSKRKGTEDTGQLELFVEMPLDDQKE